MLRDRDVLSAVDIMMRDPQREGLLRAIEQALFVAGIGLSEISAVVCGEGPGSFTSLRVAAGLAKGIASAQGLSLLAVSSLALTAAAATPPGRYVAVADALRSEVFAVPFEVEADAVREIEAHRLLRSDQVWAWAKELRASVAGPDVDGSVPRASALARVGFAATVVHPVDVASWEPVYGRLSAAQTRLAGNVSS